MPGEVLPVGLAGQVGAWSRLRIHDARKVSGQRSFLCVQGQIRASAWLRGALEYLWLWMMKSSTGCSWGKSDGKPNTPKVKGLSQSIGSSSSLSNGTRLHRQGRSEGIVPGLALQQAPLAKWVEETPGMLFPQSFLTSRAPPSPLSHPEVNLPSTQACEHPPPAQLPLQIMPA